MTTTALQTNKLLSQLVKLPDLAKKEDWEFAYDEENDQLYFAPSSLPKGVSLFSFNDEFSLYVDKSSNIKGVFIEYFKTNFTEHETEYKQIVKLLDKEKDGYKTSGRKQNHSVELAKDALSGEVLRSYYTFLEQVQAKQRRKSA